MTNEQNPSKSFFGSNVNGTKIEQKAQEFVSKGSNRKLDEPHDINFTIGSKLFYNLFTFINEMSYDVVMYFKKKEMRMIVIDPSTTHASSIRFDRIEFADYNIKDFENDDAERVVYIDSSIINDELNINENYPIDFYVDTKVNKRFYVVCGKEIVYNQLNNYEQSLMKSYMLCNDSIDKLINNNDYQKMVISQNAMNNLLSSLLKKVNKKKNESTIISLQLRKGEIDFTIKDEVKGSSVILNGEDIIISPLKDDNLSFELGYLTKLNKLRTILSYNSSLYVNKNLPILFESKFGGNKIVLYYVIAPRIEENK